MKLFASAKGQESAPFELLIAVIIMTFVMMFGYMAMEDYQKMQCKAGINQELERMRDAIESTVNQGSVSKVDFKIEQCFKKSRTVLNTVSNRTVCSRICQEGRQECVSLDFWSDGHNRRVCVNIPLHSQFEGVSDPSAGAYSGYCSDKSNPATNPIPYELLPIGNDDVGVPNGSYLFVDSTPPGWSKPIVCAYRLKGAA